MAARWGEAMGMTALVASMAVNALVTGLIVFKILKLFLAVNPISVKMITLNPTKDTKLRRIIFVIIESGMALLAIQLIRIVFWFLPAELSIINIYDSIIVIHQMFNVIIRSSIHFYFFCFTDNIFFFTRVSHQQ